MDAPLLMTVGPAEADLQGYTQRAVQAAVDHVAAFGGGTVRLLAGRYELRNAIRLRTGVRLEGVGDDTHLIKASEVGSVLAEDSDWYEAAVRVSDAGGFRVGDGVALRAKDVGGGYPKVAKRTVVAIEGRTLHLNERLRDNFWTTHEATCSTLFPLIWIEEVTDCAVAALRLDGNRDQNSLLDGNHAGCVFMQYAARVTVEDVTAHHNHGDGVSWQVADDVRVLGCRLHDHANLGLHPGSGSARPVIRDNHSHHNDIGLFFCWGVKHGVAEHNRLEDNRSYGISIGHRDTDNRVAHNVIARNGQAGITFRPEEPPARLPHRNWFEDNLVEDNGADGEGVGIWLRDRVDGTALVRNRLRDGGHGHQRVGIRLEPEVGEVRLEDNTFEGLTAVEDRRAPASATVEG